MPPNHTWKNCNNKFYRGDYLGAIGGLLPSFAISTTLKRDELKLVSPFLW